MEKKSYKDAAAKFVTVCVLGVLVAIGTAFWAIWAPSNNGRWWLTALMILVVSVLGAVAGYIVYDAGEE